MPATTRDAGKKKPGRPMGSKNKTKPKSKAKPKKK